ncbi:putative disease resistance protein [Vitis vinifera]|uniref:Putative disease resistance protein n=1 Tax=Vitis vinifera TaxID=29760 RepID=A0A438H9I4_VITVI|nr:putative disease resistance protein [Vitis vinifera]
MQLWVNQIRDAAHDAEDVLDEFMFKVEHKRQQRLHRLKFLRFLPSCVTVADKLPFIHELNDQIDVVGFETDVKSAKELLVEAGETTETRRVVVSIVGMGGLGKTTLAKKVYNDVKQHFDCDAWVYVSQEYRTRDLLFEILNCVTNEKRIMTELDSEAAVGIELRNFLSTKKYLIVMDDIWCTQVWKGLNVYLPIEGYGSRVLITARNKEVALHANSHLHELHPLNEMESEELFLRKMGSSTLVWPQGLEKLGKEIVAKCKGLPLATVMLGGLLSMKEKTQFSWQKVLDSKDWHLSQGPNSCLGILALSYNDLPNYLKSCFLYCGFVQTRGAETLEDLAEDYLYELIQRNMIQVDKRDRLDGRVKSCCIHDFLRDLAITEAKDAKLFEVLDLGVCQYQNIYTLPRKVGELINLKYLCLRGAGNRMRLPTSIVRLVNLQTLDLDGNLLCLPCKIWKLQQLRHLNCPGGIVSRKPFTERFFINGDLGVHQLTNLQTLALQGGEWLDGDGLGQLTQLRQLKIMGGLTPYLKEGFFKSIAQLTALENLKLINFSSKRKTMVSGLMSFSHHTRLQKLVLGGRLEKLPVDTGFYPPNLLQLKLWETELEQDPMSILGELPNLRILKLLWNSYVGKKMNCSEGRFHQLEFLHMEHLSNLEDFTVEEGAMPKLRTLQMEWFWKMKKFPDGLLGLRNLQELNLLHCSNELLKEVFQTQGEDWNRIRLITSQTHPISDNTSFILLDDTGFH